MKPHVLLIADFSQDGAQKLKAEVETLAEHIDLECLDASDDADKIKEKGYEPQAEPILWVCNDKLCKPPAKSVDELKKTIGL